MKGQLKSGNDEGKGGRGGKDSSGSGSGNNPKLLGKKDKKSK